MKNKEVVEEFVFENEANSGNLFSEKNYNGLQVIYSYGYHFPMAVKLQDGHFLVNCSGYSNTTSQHKGLLARRLGYENFKDLEARHDKNAITLLNTQEIKEVLSHGFKTRLEMIEAEI